jgi:hypothetical protein
MPQKITGNNIRVISKNFRKLAEIIACQGALPVSMTKMANVSPVSTTPAVNYAYCTAGVVDIGWKFATGVNDTSGKFAAGVNDTGGKY